MIKIVAIYTFISLLLGNLFIFYVFFNRIKEVEEKLESLKGIVIEIGKQVIRQK